jgi:hypothetical protein
VVTQPQQQQQQKPKQKPSKSNDDKPSGSSFRPSRGVRGGD